MIVGTTDLMVRRLKGHDKEFGLSNFYAAFLIQGLLDGSYVVADRQ